MMASSIFSHTFSCSILLVLVFLSSMATSDSHMPLTLAPFPNDNLCNAVNCGRGNCSVDVTKPLSFVCECEPGWRRTRSGKDDQLQFLPCVIPNCNDHPLLTYSSFVTSITYPSFVTTVTKKKLHIRGKAQNMRLSYTINHVSRTLDYSCMPASPPSPPIPPIPDNISLFDRAIGMDCRRLGVSMQDTTSPPNDGNTSPPNDSNSQGLNNS
ncbi:hypothetical protein CTI12_AA485640 [Artemisia annua]|uniref:EGF-like domain-containing protein n=1 Tax=Artemisia annua TaxID=35608 RepID=A0A2U1LJ44_ARTAN|nr:hypothetical protein CTI12_AA485640 [Artemisia annua]